MSKDNNACTFKTSIGGQALIEGIMMQGPKKRAIVCCTENGYVEKVVDMKPLKEISPILGWPLIRGCAGFISSMVNGVKALSFSVDQLPEDMQEEPDKIDLWIESHFSDETAQKLIIGVAVVLGIALSLFLFLFLPTFIVGLFPAVKADFYARTLFEGILKLIIFFVYLILCSKMNDMKRVFAYHGAEHKTIRCYEARLPLTVENVRKQTRLHPRCGTSFLLVVMILSILVFSVASSALLAVVPALDAMRGTILFRVIMIAFKLLLLPLVVAISYEINRIVGRYDNWLTRILTAPGMWFQYFTTNEPDDSMIEVGIAALEAVLPAQEGADQW